MATTRKTRQQKITQSKRMQSQEKVNDQEVVVDMKAATAVSPHQAEIAETQEYVRQELRQIGWISLVCIALLAAATILLADFSWTVQLREWVGLPASLI